MIERRGRSPHPRLLAALIITIVLVAFLLVGVFPTRTYLNQRAATRKAAQEVAALEARNNKLSKRVDGLRTPAEIERIAREEYGLVRPGEEAYAILPPPPPPVQLPNVWPFIGVADALNR